MFCSSCGTTLAAGLSYCNRCGARTAVATDSTEPETPREEKLADIVNLLAVIAGVVAIGGLIFVYGLVSSLLSKGIQPSVIIVFMIFSLAAVFGISWLLIRQLTRVLNAYLRAGETAKLRQLDEREIPQIEAHREPVSSVTDHTTRAFEPSYRKPNH